MPQRIIEVWHPDCPGTKLRVRRSFLGRLFKPRDFATLSEALRSSKDAMYRCSTICGRMQNKHFNRGFQAAISALFGNQVSVETVSRTLLFDSTMDTKTPSIRYHDDGVRAAIFMYEYLDLDNLTIASIHDAMTREDVI